MWGGTSSSRSNPPLLSGLWTGKMIQKIYSGRASYFVFLLKFWFSFQVPERVQFHQVPLRCGLCIDEETDFNDSCLIFSSDSEDTLTLTSRSVSQGRISGGFANARFICSLEDADCGSPLCSDCRTPA